MVNHRCVYNVGRSGAPDASFVKGYCEYRPYRLDSQKWLILCDRRRRRASTRNPRRAARVRAHGTAREKKRPTLNRLAKQQVLTTLQLRLEALELPTKPRSPAIVSRPARRADEVRREARDSLNARLEPHED